MEFHVEEKLPNIVEGGIFTKIYTEIITETKHKTKETNITGNLVITRELRGPYNMEITLKNKFPIDITVPNSKKLNGDAEICLHMKTFKLGLEKDYTEFIGDLVLTNVVEEEVKQLV